MRNNGPGLERMLEGLTFIERLIGHLEHNQPERHVRNAMKEWLLASRSVINSVIDTLEEEPSPPATRKITISKD